jgi:ElaB/YqjD/DUF883 family membrane-anchored ribosome-binding protein
MATNSNLKRRSHDTIADRTATVARDMQQIGDAARKMADHSVTAVRDTAKQYLDEGRSRLEHLGDDVQSRVAEQPIKALLVAAGIGFLIGAIWTRR